MEDGYECEGQMNIFEFLDKEQELDDSWNKWPDKIPQERGKWYKVAGGGNLTLNPVNIRVE